MGSLFGKRKTSEDIVTEAIAIYQELKSKGINHNDAMEALIKHYYPENNQTEIRAMLYDCKDCLEYFCMLKIRVDLYGGAPIFDPDFFDEEFRAPLLIHFQALIPCI